MASYYFELCTPEIVITHNIKEIDYASTDETKDSITNLSEKLQRAEDIAAKSILHYENVKNKDDLVKFYITIQPC